MTAISAYAANRTLPTPAGSPAAAPTGFIGGSPFWSSTTGYDSTPAEPTAAATPAPTSSTAARAQGLVEGQFGQAMGTDFATAAGGGPISDALLNGVAKIAVFAQNGITKIQNAIQGDMTASGGGNVDPAKLQQYTMQMSTYELLMKMAAKIQEKQENAVAAWLR